MEMSQIVEQSVTPYSSGETYHLKHTKYQKYTAYDSKPERLHRSTLYAPDGTILCASPPHLVSLDTFVKEAKGPVAMTEFIEGTLINLFYNPVEQIWDLMTKTQVSANNWFTRTEYSSFLGSNPVTGCGFVYAPQHTFREMFIDAFGGMRKYQMFVTGANKKYTYSFVLQHPANPTTVSPCPPRLYFISFQNMTEAGDDISKVITTHTCNQYIALQKDPPIYTPHIFSKRNALSTADEWRHAGEEYGTDYGVVLTDQTTGVQTVLFSELHLELTELRGNDPNMMYMCLRRMQTAANDDHNHEDSRFLAMFPWFNPIYQWTRGIANMYIQHLYNSYVGHYIHKSDQRYAPTLFYHMTQLHQRFIQAKKDNMPFRMHSKIVYEYIKTLSISALYTALTEEAAGDDMSFDKIHLTSEYY
jgi:hypothetical protein